jgi:hypothetical protein
MSSPSAPNVYVQPLVEYDRITFWWLPNSEPVESYTLECDSISYSNTYSSTINEAFVTNLSPFTQYSFKLKATNNVGDSEYGFFDTVTTGYRPDPPTSLTASEEFFTTGTTVSWIPPTYEGGSPVFDYVITAKAYGLSNVPSPENNLFLSTDFPTNTSLYPLNLSNDYKVTVQAINSCGYSPMSEHIWIYNLEHPGSILFDGTSNYCALADATNPSPFALSTTDFTVELFFKFDTPLINTPYLFSSATTSGETFSIQLQDNQFVLTYPSASGLQTETFGSSITDDWHHIAIVGETVLTNRLINIYLNGVLYHTTTNPSYSFTNPLLDFTIGQRSTPSLTTNFQGYISNLRFVSGLAVYISNFTIPNIPLGVIGGTDIQTELLLNVIDAGTLLTDSSGLNRTVTNYGVSYSLQHP